MKKKIRWSKILFTIGVIAMFVGIFNPIRLFLIVTIGAVLVTLSALAERDRHRYLYLAFTFLIITGAFFIHYMSLLGEYNVAGEWWWNLMILPYPIGWILIMAMLLVRLVRKYGKQ